jgi:MYXO-CTERM domain-containing protein
MKNSVAISSLSADLKTGSELKKRPPQLGQAVVFSQLCRPFFRSFTCHIGRGSQVLSPALGAFLLSVSSAALAQPQTGASDAGSTADSSAARGLDASVDTRPTIDAAIAEAGVTFSGTSDSPAPRGDAGFDIGDADLPIVADAGDAGATNTTTSTTTTTGTGTSTNTGGATTTSSPPRPRILEDDGSLGCACTVGRSGNDHQAMAGLLALALVALKRLRGRRSRLSNSLGGVALP